MSRRAGSGGVWGSPELRSYRINETDMNTDGERLASLADTIERLRARIEQHGDHIGGHETRTRVILIDPLLRSLGWDTEDPEMVIHEHRAGSLKLDYALVDQGKVIGILEAKALGSRLNDVAWGKYVAELPRVPVVAFTNGDEWRFFRKSNKWQPETVKVAAAPGGAFKVGFDLHHKIGRTVAPPPPPPPPPDGKTLTKLRDKIKAREFPKGKKPTRVIFEGVPIELPKRTWKQMYATVARHLVATGMIRPNTIIKPKVRRRGRPLVSSSDDGFHSAVDIGGGLWSEGNVSREMAVDNSIYLLEECGVDPSTVWVYFD